MEKSIFKLTACGLSTLFLCVTTLFAQSNADATLKQLTAQAEQLSNEQNYDAAIEKYQQIMQQDVFESAPPTKYLEIAKLHYLKGDSDQAKSQLEKARVALQLKAGIFRCQESANAPEYQIVNANGEVENSAHAVELANRVCNYFTLENYFYPHSLDEFLQYAERIKSFKQLEALIIAK